MTSKKSPTSSLTGSDEQQPETTPRRVRGRPWPPGVSGNPKGGKRKGTALAEAVRRGADPEELVALALKIARHDRNTGYRLQALAWLRDAGYQRPAERHEVLAITATPLDAQRYLDALSTAALRELADVGDTLTLAAPNEDGGDNDGG